MSRPIVFTIVMCLGTMTSSANDVGYTPLLTYQPGGALVQARLRLASRFEGVGAFEVDADGTALEPPFAANLLARVGVRFDSRRSMALIGFGLRFELDAIGGVVTGDPGIDGVALPNSEGYENVIRHANIRFSAGPYLHLIGGLMVSDWGMGLIANGGERGWAPGNASFNDPRRGDRVLRAMVVSGPLTAQNLTLAVGYDWVQDDDILLDGDKANQVVGALRFGVGKPYSGGFYVAYRSQTRNDVEILKAYAVDATTSMKFDLGSLELKIDAELAFITGETTLGPNTEFPTHDVRQIGAAFRASLNAENAGFVFDLLYATGDQNLDDGQQNAFKADRNYQLGFLTFRYLVAGQTGRAPFTASDPTLTGQPAPDLERFPTRGAMTNTISLFPRGWWRPVNGLEIYGGPLLVLSEVALVDPLQTRLAGGSPRNALGGKPSQYLATEFDLGIRYRGLFGGTELTIAIEGGVVLPGGAYEGAEGNSLDSIFGGRAMLEYRL